MYFPKYAPKNNRKLSLVATLRNSRFVIIFSMITLMSSLDAVFPNLSEVSFIVVIVLIRTFWQHHFRDDLERTPHFLCFFGRELLLNLQFALDRKRGLEIRIVTRQPEFE